MQYVQWPIWAQSRKRSVKSYPELFKHFCTILIAHNSESIVSQSKRARISNVSTSTYTLQRCVARRDTTRRQWTGRLRLACWILRKHHFLTNFLGQVALAIFICFPKALASLDILPAAAVRCSVDFLFLNTHVVTTRVIPASWTQKGRYLCM